MSEGDIIKPGTDVYYPTSAAYATRSLGSARYYAKKWDDPRNYHPDEQRPLFHPVYEVEHVSRHSDPDDQLPFDYRRDEKGFRVKGIADWSIGSL